MDQPGLLHFAVKGGDKALVEYVLAKVTHPVLPDWRLTGD